MSEKILKYREMYKRGILTEAQLDRLVEMKVITKAEKELIMAEENKKNKRG